MTGFRALGVKLRGIVVGCLVYVIVATPSAANAIFGEENIALGAILTENIKQLAQMVKTVTGIATQIAQLRTMITQGETMLRGAKDPQGLLNLMNYARYTLRSLERIERDAKRLRYQLETIDKERAEVFPKMKDVPTGEFRAKARVWNEALQESSASAMKAQTSVTTLEQRGEHAQRLLERSDDARGIVEQLQLVVRALGLLHSDLAALETNLAAGQRVTATMAGVQAAEAARTEEINTRMLERYTERGAPATVLQELP